jgi:hypothetical protein
MTWQKHTAENEAIGTPIAVAHSAYTERERRDAGTPTIFLACARMFGRLTALQLADTASMRGS